MDEYEARMRTLQTIDVLLNASGEDWSGDNSDVAYLVLAQLSEIKDALKALSYALLLTNGITQEGEDGLAESHNEVWRIERHLKEKQ